MSIKTCTSSIIGAAVRCSIENQIKLFVLFYSLNWQITGFLCNGKQIVGIWRVLICETFWVSEQAKFKWRERHPLAGHLIVLCTEYSTIMHSVRYCPILHRDCSPSCYNQQILSLNSFDNVLFYTNIQKFCYQHYIEVVDCRSVIQCRTTAIQKVLSPPVYRCRWTWDNHVQCISITTVQ